MKKLVTVFSNFANKGSSLKKVFLLFASTVYTMANCVPLTYSKDVPIGYSLPLADLNPGDASVVFVLNNAPTENLSNTGGWNYIITKAPKLTTAETQGTNILTVTTHGAAGDTVAISVTFISTGGFPITWQLGTATSTGVSVTADASAIAAAINGTTATTGFSATSALGVVTLKNPAGSGASLNGTAVTLVASTGSVQVITNTTLGSTVAGVTAVNANAEVVVSQMPNPLIPGDYVNANISTKGGLNDAIAAYQAYTYHSY